jgi:hypothetical protein
VTPLPDAELALGSQHVALAASQLDLALREAAEPAALLGESLVHACDAAERMRVASLAGDTPAMSAANAELTLHLMHCIERLQFHDRMTQHLGHVCTYLGDVSGGWTRPEALSKALVRFRGRLISEAQRALLDLMQFDLEAMNATRQHPVLHAAPGSVELF